MPGSRAGSLFRQELVAQLAESNLQFRSVLGSLHLHDTATRMLCIWHKPGGSNRRCLKSGRSLRPAQARGSAQRTVMLDENALFLQRRASLDAAVV